MGYTNQDPGCCCGGCDTKICLANTCGSGGSGTNVPVTILSGSTTISSGTTDNTGCVVLSIPNAGTYTVTTAATARYNSTSGSHALTCGGVISITLTPKSDHSCLPCFQEPVPNTLYLTVAGTAYPVVNINSGPTITASVPISNLLTTTQFAPDCATVRPNPCTIAAGNLSVPFIFGSGGCNVDQRWFACTDCSHDSGISCPSPKNSSTYPYYNNSFNDATFIGLWKQGIKCFGICNGGISDSLPSWTSRPVPVNITINFPNSIDGTTPPVLTATLTE